MYKPRRNRTFRGTREDKRPHLNSVQRVRTSRGVFGFVRVIELRAARRAQSAQAQCADTGKHFFEIATIAPRF